MTYIKINLDKKPWCSQELFDISKMRTKCSQPRVTYGNYCSFEMMTFLIKHRVQLSFVSRRAHRCIYPLFQQIDFFYERDLNSSTRDGYRYDRTSINCSIEQPKPLFITYITIYYGINKWPHPLFSVFCNCNAARYNAVNFPTNIHQRQPIAHPLGRGIVCLLRIQHLIDILPQFL